MSQLNGHPKPSVRQNAVAVVTGSAGATTLVRSTFASGGSALRLWLIQLWTAAKALIIFVLLLVPSLLVIAALGLVLILWPVMLLGEHAMRQASRQAASATRGGGA